MMAEVEEELFEVTCIENSELYQCSSCNLTFEDVDLHLKEFHSETKKLPVDDENLPDDEENVEYCLVADEEDPLDSLLDADGTAFVIKTRDGKFECKECFRTYKYLRRFLDHVKTHGNVTQENIQKLEEHIKQLEESEDFFEETKLVAGGSQFRCKVCNTIFNTRKKILLHYSIHQNVARAQKKHFASKEEESLHCKLCNRSLNNSYEMKMHLSAHAENNAHGLRQPSSTVKKPQKKKADGDGTSVYPCQYCQKEFKRPHEKVKHERIHTGEKPYSCDICGKQFRVTYCLSLHKRNVHSQERPYVCSFDGCNKRFKSQSVYNHHLNTHGTAKNYKCPFCPKAFKTSVQLAGHKNTHTKPFSCQVCSRAFASLYAVKIHMEIHRNLDTNLKYTCRICSAQYGRSFALKDHLKADHPGMDNEETAEELENDEHYVIEESEPMVEEEDDEVYSVVMIQSDTTTN